MTHNISRSFYLMLALGCVAFGVAGCGKMTVAPVSGVVTLYGVPLKSASVVFHPQPGGRPSYGVTDEEGHYSLAYSMQDGGAEVGSCRVNISTALEAEDGASQAEELVPKRYFAEDPILVEVKPSSNNINIELTSK